MDHNEKFRNDIGEIIRVKRQEHGYTQADLAEAIGSSTNTIQNLESGKTYPSIQKAALIDHVLDTFLSKMLIKRQINESVQFIDVFERFEYAIDEENHDILIQQKQYLEWLKHSLPSKSYHYKLCSFYRAYITYISENKTQALEEFQKCLNLKTKNSYLMDELNRRILLKMLDCEMSMHQQVIVKDEIVEKICQRIYKDIYKQTNSYKIQYKALIKIIEIRIFIQNKYELGIDIAKKAKKLVVEKGDAFDNYCVIFYKGICEYMYNEDKIHAEAKISLALEFFRLKGKVEVLRKYHRILKQLNIKLSYKI